ncbi:MAG: CPBP family intramembrane metalloprotease domain-containing protein [Gammaproteobacteria bacterium]|nr:MAG: CPBP family intramembrane metalloprotease domain-containing protein [Gammaproteobacteria bacterium]
MLNKILLSLIPFLVLLIFSFVGCIIGYWLFIALDGRLDLSKLISKSTQVLLILSIYPVMRWLRINAADMGFVPWKAFLRQILSGMVLGLLTLLPVLVLSYFLGITTIDEAKDWTLGSFTLSVLVTLGLGLLISLLEEPMFRGILISAYLKRVGLMASVFLSSFYYALLHFIKTKTSIPVEQAKFTDSFRLLLEAYQNLLNPDHLGAFWALLMVGVFLAVMRTRLKLSLAWCIGCHAVWVCQIKMAHKITDVNYSSDLLYLISPYDGVIGPMVAIWLTLVLCAYLVYEWLQSLKKSKL